MADQNIQQWQDQYNQLRQNYINLTGAIDDFKSVYGEDTKSPAFFEAQRLQLRLEYQINQHIDAAVEAGGNALYEEYRGQILIARSAVAIDGVLYNNRGLSLTWDSNTRWGVYNQLIEARNIALSQFEFESATFFQVNRADIKAFLDFSVKEFVVGYTGEVFGSITANQNPVLNKINEDLLGEVLDKNLPESPIGQTGYDTLYEFFFGSYEPLLDEVELPNSLLYDSSQAFFQTVESGDIEAAISNLEGANQPTSNFFEQFWDNSSNFSLKLLQSLLDFLITPAYGDDINPLENDLYKAARVYRVPVRRDPLTLDLDGDGLETTPFNAANPVFFDHDLNGIKEGTGWVGADDGFLVYDRNGNNVIDNGSELFGDHTPRSGGGYTADGFAALAQEDTNQDGKVDTNDAHFANLRVWRDLNQNGLSESNELFTLAQLGITGINVGKAVSCNL